MIYASYEAGSMTATQVDADFVKLADVEAVRFDAAPDARISISLGIAAAAGCERLEQWMRSGGRVLPILQKLLGQ